jgi:hypothetical protein
LGETGGWAIEGAMGRPAGLGDGSEKEGYCTPGVALDGPGATLGLFSPSNGLTSLRHHHQKAQRAGWGWQIRAWWDKVAQQLQGLAPE